MKIPSNRSKLAGSVLLLALVSTAVVGVLLAAYLTLVKTQNQSIMRSQVWNAAIPVIEAGIEDAMTHLNKHGKTNINCDFWKPSGTGYLKEQVVGEDGYYNVFIYNYVPGGTNLNQTPIIESRGFIRPPVMVASSGMSRAPLMAAAVMAIPARPDGLIGRGVKATCKVDPLFAKGMVALGLIDLNGNNAVTDSFNSLTTNNVGGRYAPSVALGHGDIATDGALANVGNATINGKVSTGPGGTVAVKSGGLVTGGTTDDMNIDFPDASIPWDSSTVIKYAAEAGFTTTDGTKYTASFTSGNYQLAGKISLSGKDQYLIQGSVTMYLPQGFDISGGGFILAKGANLVIYTGADSSIGGNGIANKSDPTECIIYGLPSCSSINIMGNGEFCGLIYAPNAALKLGGGGNSNYSFTGASVSKTATLGGNVSFYYDEAIRLRGPIRGFVLSSWNEMDPADVRNVPVAN